ncbi:MAG: tripartite tricarboxylate transporter TctB family protein [Spirochaetales bacterium]|nr:tripartite tricarboxylate transporter TctB family protein [Spirochaetales bacterium]
MNMKKKDVSELFVTWLFALPVFVALFEMHTKFVEKGMHQGGGETNAAMFPRMLSWLLLSLIIVRTADILIKSRKKHENHEPVILFEKAGRKRLVMISGILVLYFFGLGILGYYAATPLALAGFFLVLGLKKPIILIPLCLGVTVAVWYVFGILLKVILPVGRFGLYI